MTEFQELVESYEIMQETSRSGAQEGTGKRLYDPDGSLRSKGAEKIFTEQKGDIAV